MLIWIGLSVGCAVVLLALGALPEHPEARRRREAWEDDEQAAILSGRPLLEPQEQASVHRGGL